MVKLQFLAWSFKAPKPSLPPPAWQVIITGKDGANTGRVCTWQAAHEEGFYFSVLYNEPKPRKLWNLPQVTRQEWRSRNLRLSCLFPKPVQYTATGSIRKDCQPHKSRAVSLRCGNSGDLSRVHSASLFIESWGALSHLTVYHPCELAQGPHRPSLCTIYVYFSICLCNIPGDSLNTSVYHSHTSS